MEKKLDPLRQNIMDPRKWRLAGGPLTAFL